MPGILQEQIAVMYPLMTRSFARAQIAASLAASPLNAIETRAASGTLNVQGMVTPFAGSIVALTASLSGAASAGSLTLDVTVNGVVSGFQAILTTAATGYTVREYGTVRFNAGDTIGVKITTNAAWNGTTSDLLALVAFVWDDARF